MSETYTMGIDIGTFETKGMLVDKNHRVVVSHAVPHGMENPHPGHFEHDAETVWWQDFCAVSRALIQKAGIAPEQVRCVGASCLGCDCLPVDENCRPLRPAILYGIDARAGEEIAWLEELYGKEGALARFGRAMCSDDIAPKILWIKNHEPAVYAKTHKFITGSTYITARLTGNYVIDHFLAKSSFKPLYRMEDGAVVAEECGPFCRPDQLAACANSTDIAGGVTAEAAVATGLKEGTPVIVGTGDSTAEAVSGGAVEPGRLLFQFGSSLFFYFCVDRLIQDQRVHAGYFTVPGTYSLAGGTNAAGTLTRWVRDQFYFDALADEAAGGENAYAVMAAQAAKIPPGSEGLVMLPYLYGERSPIHDPQAKGMLFGLSGHHTRHHINRAALESIGYSIRQHIELFRSLGLGVDVLMTAGGGTKNPAWMQAVADIIGIPVEVAGPFQSASYGDAMMAKIGIGELESFAALGAAIPKATTVQPNMDNHKLYTPLYDMFLSLYQNNKELMHRL